MGELRCTHRVWVGHSFIDLGCYSCSMAESPCSVADLYSLEYFVAVLREQEDRHARLRCILALKAKERDIAFAHRQAAVEMLQQARAKKHFWAVRAQLWKGLIKLRHASIELAVKKRRSDHEDRNYYRSVLRKALKEIEFLERRQSDMAADTKKQQRDFEQLREKYMEIGKLHGDCKDSMEIANAPQQLTAAPQQAFKCILRKIPFPIHLDSHPIPFPIHLESQPVPRYCVQV